MSRSGAVVFSPTVPRVPSRASARSSQVPLTLESLGVYLSHSDEDAFMSQVRALTFNAQEISTLELFNQTASPRIQRLAHDCGESVWFKPQKAKGETRLKGNMGCKLTSTFWYCSACGVHLFNVNCRAGNVEDKLGSAESAAKHAVAALHPKREQKSMTITMSSTSDEARSVELICSPAEAAGLCQSLHLVNQALGQYHPGTTLSASLALRTGDAPPGGGPSAAVMMPSSGAFDEDSTSPSDSNPASYSSPRSSSEGRRKRFRQARASEAEEEEQPPGATAAESLLLMHASSTPVSLRPTSGL